MKISTSFALGISIMGIILAFYGIEAERSDKKGDKWVQTNAIITQKFIRLHDSTEPYNLLEDVNRKGEDNRLFIPEVRFIYEVDGEKYGGTKLSPVVLPAQKDIAKQIVALYRRGMKVKAYYNKDNPADAVLYKHFQKPRVTTLTGFGMIIFGTFILWISAKFTKGPRESQQFYKSVWSLVSNRFKKSAKRFE